MKNSLLRKTFVLCAVAITAFVFTSAVNAQGRYGNIYSKRDVSGIINKLEQSSNTFRRDFDTFLDQSSLNGTSEEDRLNRIVSDYERNLNRLRREYDSQDNWWESRRNVEDVMNSARSVNSMMNNLPFARKLERQWRNMRTDLNKLADTYDLPSLDNVGGGGVGGNVPSWALGTFYGRNPETGGTISITINANGSVTADFQGSIAYGSYRDNRLYISGAEARITRLNNGIRTRRPDTGLTIDYYRTGTNDGGGVGGNVPNWAVGTFYGRNPETGGTISITISANGYVTADFQGSYANGTFRNNRIFISGAEARVTRLNNGIRTRRADTGLTIDYYRTPSSGGNTGDADVPNWALGTFYGTNPETGGTISVTISANGSVTANFGGSVSYGTFRNNRIYIGGAEARVTRLNNGIRTRRTDNGYTIDYYRR